MSEGTADEVPCGGARDDERARAAQVPRVVDWAIGLAIAVGVLLRFGTITERAWRADELATLVVVAGCTDADLRRTYDGRPHTADELLACQRVSRTGGDRDLARAVLDEGPQNLPLYFLAARAATRALGWEWSPRLVSSVASTLALAGGALLGRTLLGSSYAGAVVAALAAVSPLQVRFGLDARDYALWSLFTVLSAWLLLRAYGANRGSDWWRYGIAQALAVQANLLALPAALGLLGWGLVTTVPPRLARGAPLRRHAATLALAALTLVPWLGAAASFHGTVRRTLGWTALPMPTGELVRRWLGNATEIFLRTGADGGLVGAGSDQVSVVLRSVLAGLAILLLGAATVALVRARPVRVWSFPLLLGGPLFLAFALADVVLGGRRSMMARYVMPAWWAVELLVAGGFVACTSGARSPRIARAASRALVLLLALGAASSVAAALQPAWWDTVPDLQRAQLAEAGWLQHADASSADRASDTVYWIPAVPKYQLLGFVRVVPPGTRFVLGALPPEPARARCAPVTIFHADIGVPDPLVLRCDATSLAPGA